MSNKQHQQRLIAICLVTAQIISCVAATPGYTEDRGNRNNRQGNNDPRLNVRNNYNSDFNMQLDKGNKVSYTYNLKESVKTTNENTNKWTMNELDANTHNRIVNQVLGGSNEEEPWDGLGNYERRVTTRITGDPGIIEESPPRENKDMSEMTKEERVIERERRQMEREKERERRQRERERLKKERERERLRNQRERERDKRERERNAREWDRFDREMDRLMNRGRGNRGGGYGPSRRAIGFSGRGRGPTRGGGMRGTDTQWDESQIQGKSNMLGEENMSGEGMRESVNEGISDQGEARSRKVGDIEGGMHEGLDQGSGNRAYNRGRLSTNTGQKGMDFFGNNFWNNFNEKMRNMF